MRYRCGRRAEGLGIGRRDTDEAAQYAARVGETEAGFEVPDEGEDVAFGFAQRVPPAAAVMVDDDDLAFAAAVFEAAAAALRAVEPPDRRQPLQQRSAAHAALQPFDFCVLLVHRCVLLVGSARQGDHVLCSLFILSCRPISRQPRSRRGARACTARERSARRTLAARPALAVALRMGSVSLGRGRCGTLASGYRVPQRSA